jgi:membrane-associated protease RseP (regulator of RpoE activity)
VKSKLPLHIFLFSATFITLTLKEKTLEVVFVLFRYLIGSIFMNLTDEITIEIHTYLQEISIIATKELSYSIPLILILLAHEMGHYLPARYYGIKATLPYFIPMPIGPIGTMGAVIKIHDPIGNKKELFDIGVGGPLMSLILSIPCWIVGLYYSNIVLLDEYFYGLPKENILLFGDSLFTYWTIQWIHGSIDFTVQNIVVHPLAQAGWVGFFITAINLFPFGQLDGGHVIYSIFGEKYRKWIYHLFLVFLFLGLINFNWVIWGFIIYFFIKIEHPYVPDSKNGIDKNRKFLGYFMLISLIFIFVPVPIITYQEMNQNSILQDIIKFLSEGIFKWF